MSTGFQRASIVPFDAAGGEPVEDAAIAFDFNPQSLTLKVTASRPRDPQRRGRQQVQHVGTSEATLNFEAVFDSTRPRDGDDGRAVEAEEKLDVRLRTRPLAALIQQAETQPGADASQQPAPKRVQFRWGSIVFNGLITQYQETFEYFSPGGVPLRSKLQITLTEQEFRYEVNSADRAAARAATPPTPAGLRDAAAGAGADSLFGLGSAGLSLGLSADLSLGFSADFDIGVSAGLSLQGNLGLSADLGLSLGAGISMSADAAVDVFGVAALSPEGSGATAGRAGLSLGTQGATAGPANPWAPDGPAPGSRAASLAAVVTAQRAAGSAFAAPNAPETPRPLPVRGSPPPALPRAPSGTVSPALRSARPQVSANALPRPRWEAPGLSATRARAAAPAHTARAGCGCARCGGGY